MGRLTALTVSALVTVIVFLALARPLLLELLGPEALLLAYAAVAITTGATVYVLLRRVTTVFARRRETVSESTDTDPQEEQRIEDELVEKELKQLSSESS
ncbi:hypothetical protein [Haloarcula amylovorans]|uniref:hypothetical protein n=1 Tax=Haloarcula amylovorans TaxID=2562280 RepID=UPI00107647BC|nr:hypothetical protein [Halomicroarcula amylolytica]